MEKAVKADGQALPVGNYQMRVTEREVHPRRRANAAVRALGGVPAGRTSEGTRSGHIVTFRRQAGVEGWVRAGGYRADVLKAAITTACGSTRAAPHTLAFQHRLIKEHSVEQPNCSFCLFFLLYLYTRGNSRVLSAVHVTLFCISFSHFSGRWARRTHCSAVWPPDIAGGPPCRAQSGKAPSRSGS
jgi:hypothetical protein